VRPTLDTLIQTALTEARVALLAERPEVHLLRSAGFRLDNHVRALRDEQSREVQRMVDALHGAALTLQAAAGLLEAQEHCASRRVPHVLGEALAACRTSAECTLDHAGRMFDTWRQEANP
jgi:hypothetical protein